MAEFAPCPQCGSVKAEKVSYTIWGGMIGPRLLNHVKCQDCKATFNGKTGKSNTGAITIYLVAMFVLAFVIFFVAALVRS
jgi:transposase-like protein